MEEEARIQRAASAAAAGDRDARARCVELAYPHLRGLARRYDGRGVSRDDLEQEVALGIMRAIERYDPSRGTPFLAWAHTWVRQALQQAIAEQSRPFRLTRHALWDLHEAKSAQEQLWQRDHSEPTVGRLADELGWPQERVTHVLRSGQTAEHPDAIDLVSDPLSHESYEDVITRVTATQLRPLLLALPEREREILDRRANDETLRAVARSLGLAHQRVAALEERAFSRVRAAAGVPRDAEPTPGAARGGICLGARMSAPSTLRRWPVMPSPRVLAAIAAVLAAFFGAHTDAARAGVTVAQTAHAAASVHSALIALSESGHLTAAERFRYRRSLRQAMRVVRTLDLPSKARRRDELGSQIVMLRTLSARGKLTPGRMRPLFRQLDANRAWFARSGPPKPLARVAVAGDPLVYAYYPGHGLQFQPLFNWTKVNGYWFAKDYAGMQALIDELAPLAVPQRGGWVSWEYAFDYPGSRAPWLSGMAQGVAIQALARAWQATQDSRDLALAQQALPGLGRRLAAGGLLVKSATGRWWPLYTEHPSLRVLNGDLQAVISLYDYAAITGDAQALAWAQDGAHTAAAVLPRYDTGAWSRYHGSREADLGYHDLMTLQLRQLALKSGDPVFRTYADRFAAYRVTPPVIAATTTGTVRAYPSVVDSPHAAARVHARLSKISRVTLVVTDAAGSTVAASRLGTHRRGPLKVRWNAHVRRRPAVAGDYQLWLSATDLAGNRSPRTPVGVVAVERDTQPPAVRILRIGRADGRVRLRWRSADNASARLRIRVSVAGHTAMLRGVPLSGRRTLSLPAPRGGFTAWITVSDESGNDVAYRRRAP